MKTRIINGTRLVITSGWDGPHGSGLVIFFQKQVKGKWEYLTNKEGIPITTNKIDYAKVVCNGIPFGRVYKDGKVFKTKEIIEEVMKNTGVGYLTALLATRLCRNEFGYPESPSIIGSHLNDLQKSGKPIQRTLLSMFLSSKTLNNPYEKYLTR